MSTLQNLLMRECQSCHFLVDEGVRCCPKCDEELSAQTDGSYAVIDIAHDGQTIDQALAQLDQAIESHLNHLTQRIRVVIGSGRIGEAAASRMSWYVHQGRVVSAQQDGGNWGAWIVELKR